MKPLKYLVLLLILTLSFSSCSNNDDNSSSSGTSGNIVGVWIAESVNFTGSQTVIINEESTTTNLTGLSYDEDFTLTITENPNTFINEGVYYTELSSEALENVISYPVNVNGENYTWSRQGNILTINNDDEFFDYEIITLTNNALVLIEEVVIDDSENDVTSTTTIVSTLSFIR